MAAMSEIRHDWTRQQVLDLLGLPFADLMQRAHAVHRAHHDANAVQVSTLLSIKTGGCPEDCAYCPQAARYATGVDAEKLMPLERVLERAREAKAAGATRFCMGAAWRSPKDRDLPKVAAMIQGVRELGMETCATLGMLSAQQAQTLRSAGLDYYNHNLDSAPEFYSEIIHTREYQDRLDTLGHVRHAGLKTCCGGIVGMGETRAQRAGLLQTLANLPEHPQSVPINRLVQVEGTPLAGSALLDPAEVVLADENPLERPTTSIGLLAHGFYWTEGLGGLGWAVDAVPTLKNGSTIGIPSPPAVFMTDGSIVKPCIPSCCHWPRQPSPTHKQCLCLCQGAQSLPLPTTSGLA